MAISRPLPVRRTADNAATSLLPDVFDFHRGMTRRADRISLSAYNMQGGKFLKRPVPIEGMQGDGGKWLTWQKNYPALF